MYFVLHDFVAIVFSALARIKYVKDMFALLMVINVVQGHLSKNYCTKYFKDEIFAIYGT